MEQALELLKTVIIWSGIISTPFLAAMAVLYIYDWLNKKMKRVPRIPKKQIVGMTAEEGDKEFGINQEDSEEPNSKEPIDYNKLTLNELKALPFIREIKGFSRKTKAELVALAEAHSQAHSQDD